MVQVAEYSVGLKVDADRKELAKVDQLLSQIEARMRKFAQSQQALKLDFGNFLKFDPIKMRASVQRSLDQVSRTTYFDLKNFRIDQQHLTSQLRSALERASATTRFRPHLDERGVRSEGGRHLRTGLGAGIGAASGISLGRVYPAVLAAAGGAYGLSALNQQNQKVQSAELTTQAVVQQALGASYTQNQGDAAVRWLKQQGDRVGFNWLEAANDYNNVISGITGAGGTVEQGQNIFKGFSEYGRVNHIDTERQKRVFRALSQVAGKGKLQADELTQQLGESLPGALSIFAQAYQEQQGTGLTGQPAIEALLAAMKKGQVKSDILNPAARIASERAAPSLAHAAKTSQSEQARYENAVNRLITLANQSGVESGYARIFKTLNDGLEEAGPLVRSLSQGFDELSQKFRVLMLVPQSFQRMLQGRDSFITDLIGKDNAEQIRQSIDSIKTSWEELKKSFGETSWGDYLKSTLKEVQMILAEFARISAASAGATRYKQYLIEQGENQSVAEIKAAGKFLATGRSETDNIPAYQEEQQRKYPLRSELDAKYKAQDQKSQVNGDVPIVPGMPNIPSFDPIDPQGRVNGMIQRTTDAVAAQNQVQQDVERNTTNNNDNRVNVTLGDITIQTSATDAQGIATDFGQHVRDLMGNILSETRIQYPSIGR